MFALAAAATLASQQLWMAPVMVAVGQAPSSVRVFLRAAAGHVAVGVCVLAGVAGALWKLERGMLRDLKSLSRGKGGGAPAKSKAE